MTNIELIMNPYIAPIYVSATNMLYPLTIITFNNIYTNVLSFSKLFINFVSIMLHTFNFIIIQGKREIINYLYNIPFSTELMSSLVEKSIYLICILNLVLNISKIKEQLKQKEQIEALERHINFLKKNERMRENMEEMWRQETKLFYGETDKKFNIFEKKIKKFEKELKAYD